MFDAIKTKEFLWILGFYFFMAISYYTVLAIDYGKLINLWTVILNHGLKAIITIAFWWFFFKKIAAYPIHKKLLLHIIGLPLFSLIWIYCYYQLSDSLGLIRLRGSQRVWDLYLSALFYIIQFGIFHLYTYYKQLRKQQLIAAQLSKLSLQSELSALKAQLNPHFLYNVFNTINAAIPTTAKNARHMVNQLSDLFRYQLKASREELVTVKEELDFVENYLQLEKERFGDRLKYHIEGEASIMEAYMPPLLLQPIVENAIKHGLASLIEGGSIDIRIGKPDHNLNIRISDTGVGLKGEQKDQILQKGIGLSNTNERLKKMYQEELVFSDNFPTGLIVQFSIPIT